MDESITVEQLRNIEEYESVADVIRTAHIKLNESGIYLNTSSVSKDEILDKLGSKGITWVARYDKSVVGTLSVCIERINKWRYKGDCAVIRFVAVHPEHQGKRIASTLMKAAESCIKEYPVTLVTTAEHNYNAVRLYKKHGYIPTERFLYNNHYCISFSKWKSLWRAFFARLIYLKSLIRASKSKH